jgi:hypothetical protein
MKQYTKHALIAKQTVPEGAIRCYDRVSTRIE